jgi:hypothetical protein
MGDPADIGDERHWITPKFHAKVGWRQKAGASTTWRNSPLDGDLAVVLTCSNHKNHAYSHGNFWHCRCSCTRGLCRQRDPPEFSRLRYCRLSGFRVSIAETPAEAKPGREAPANSPEPRKETEGYSGALAGIGPSSSYAAGPTPSERALAIFRDLPNVALRG